MVRLGTVFAVAGTLCAAVAQAQSSDPPSAPSQQAVSTFGSGDSSAAPSPSSVASSAAPSSASSSAPASSSSAPSSAAAAPAAAPSPSFNSSGKVPYISRVVVFGDSYVDLGNGDFVLSNKTWPADSAYADGRFTNGMTWPEQLAQKLRADMAGYAFGGATTNNSLVQGLAGLNDTIQVPDLAMQVDNYLKDAQNKSDPNGLYILAAGSNDFFFGMKNDTNPVSLANRSVDSLLTQADRLASTGAKYLMIPTLTDMGRLPHGLNYTNASSSAGATMFANVFNEMMKSRAKMFLNQSSTVYVVDMQNPLLLYMAQAQQNNVTNVTDACLRGVHKVEIDAGVPRSLCENPNTYVFWDIYHPTSHTHQQFAMVAANEMDLVASRAKPKMGQDSNSVGGAAVGGSPSSSSALAASSTSSGSAAPPPSSEPAPAPSSAP
ncbi:ester hydrolase [Malassezia pachydermatis]|uniref:Gdsl family lipase n=1 Tax=Malassezia pachydermatis TaxID=77020 RepID=A0A0M9VQS1_9BASI|nr:gdsl family lipase [Malassezia pachydermatis]KOS15799.1 gdsl family lipase [Malassezia pachydermatis]